jgi:hypothetical protein
MLVFPVWISKRKIYVLCVYFPLYFFCSFIENMFAIKYCTRLKYTFDIRPIIRFRGTLLWSLVWLKTVISHATVGYMQY